MGRSASAAAAPRKRPSTREQILDAAEELFSRYGLHDVMLRDVTGQVGVDHSLLHYYFKDKQELFDAVVARRTPITCAKRMAALDAYEAQADGNYYGALAAQMSKVPECGTEIIDAHFDPVALRVIDLLEQALPGCPREDVFWGYHFVAGALMVTMARADRVDRLSGGACDTQDVSAMKDRLAQFMAGGFLHVCAARAGQRGGTA
jgi:AcrR family transcriptional regulator